MPVHMLAQPEIRLGKGPIGIILASFRELCLQTHHEADNITRFAPSNLGLGCYAVHGGASAQEPASSLLERCDVFVCTLGRLIQLLN